jgi:hypothetical protein
MGGMLTFYYRAAASQAGGERVGAVLGFMKRLCQVTRLVEAAPVFIDKPPVSAHSPLTQRRGMGAREESDGGDVRSAAVRGSFTRRMRHRDVHDPSPVAREDHEHKEQPEGDRRRDEEVCGHDLARVIREEGPPRL